MHSGYHAWREAELARMRPWREVFNILARLRLGQGGNGEEMTMAKKKPNDEFRTDDSRSCYMCNPKAMTTSLCDKHREEIYRRYQKEVAESPVNGFLDLRDLAPRVGGTGEHDTLTFDEWLKRFPPPDLSGTLGPVLDNNEGEKIVHMVVADVDTILRPLLERLEALELEVFGGGR